MLKFAAGILDYAKQGAASGSMTGARAIAPPSQMLAKAPRKGIGSLPSPKKPRGMQAPMPFLPLTGAKMDTQNQPIAHTTDTSLPFDPETYSFGAADFPLMRPVLGSQRPDAAQGKQWMGLAPESRPPLDDYLQNGGYEDSMQPVPQPMPQQDQSGINQLRDLARLFPMAQPAEDRRMQKLIYDEDGNARLMTAPETPQQQMLNELRKEFTQNLDNKRQYDYMQKAQGNRDMRDFRYDDFGANVFLPLAGAFMGKGSRKFLDDKAAGMNDRLLNQRKMRTLERAQQFAGDRYYNDMMMGLDPRTPENLRGAQASGINYMNALAGMNNSINRGENYDSLAEFRKSQAENNANKTEIMRALEELKRNAQNNGTWKQQQDAANNSRKTGLAEQIANTGSYDQRQSAMNATRKADLAEQIANEGSFAQKQSASNAKRMRDQADERISFEKEKADKLRKDALDRERAREREKAFQLDPKTGKYKYSQAVRDAVADKYDETNLQHVTVAKEAFAQAQKEMPGLDRSSITKRARAIARERGIIVEQN